MNDLHHVVNHFICFAVLIILNPISFYYHPHCWKFHYVFSFDNRGLSLCVNSCNCHIFIVSKMFSCLVDWIECCKTGYASFWEVEDQGKGFCEDWVIVWKVGHDGVMKLHLFIRVFFNDSHLWHLCMIGLNLLFSATSYKRYNIIN